MKRGRDWGTSLNFIRKKNSGKRIDEAKQKRMMSSPRGSSQNLMTSRFGEKGQHRREDERRHKQDTNTHHVGPVGVEADREVVEQPDRDNEQKEDYQGDGQGHTDIDAVSREVSNVRIRAFTGGFLSR